jgi:DNA recombination protein RmuC
MEIFLFSLPFALIAITALLLLKLFNSERKLREATSASSILEERSKNLDEKLQTQNIRIAQLEQQNSDLLIFKGRFNQAEQSTLDLKQKLYNSEEKTAQHQNKILAFEKQNSLLQQEKENLKKEKEEWSDKKQAILFQLSEELIKKNNTQQDDFSKKQQEVIEKTVFNLNEKFANILNKVSSLDDDVKKTFDDINFTKNALLTPGGAGRVSEITLENILNASGLKEKKTATEIGDFIMQSHFFDQNNSLKRPDAMVFLPKNHILIIDSKSSSHFLQLQQSLDGEIDAKTKKEIETKIKESMRRHLEELKKRDYASAKANELAKEKELNLKEFSNHDTPPTITTIMFLQTEKMLEIARSLDPNFERKALEARIQVLSPVGLINLLYQVKFLIDNVKQEKNVEKLRIEIRKLMESVSTLFKRSSQMGDSFKKTLNTYNQFAGTFNSRFLPRITNMHKLGIESEGATHIQKLQKIGPDNDLIDIQTPQDNLAINTNSQTS